MTEKTPAQVAAEHAGFAAAVAVGFFRRHNFPAHVEIDELVGDAYLGLTRAAQHHEEARCFRAFARTYIVGQMLDGIRRRAWVPEYHRQNRGKKRMIAISQLGRHVRNLAESRIMTDFDRIDLVDWSDRAMRRMTAREQQVVRLIHFQGLSPGGAGKQMGITSQRIGQILREIYRRLREL